MATIKRRPKKKLKKRSGKRNVTKEQDIAERKARLAKHKKTSDVLRRQGADNALRLFKDLQEGLVDPRDLSRPQRKAVLVFMADGSKTSNQLAAIFKVSRHTIRQDLREIKSELGTEYSEWTMNEVLGDLALSAESFVAKALKDGDIGLAWTIKKDLIKTFKDFGLVGNRESRDGLKITIESMGENYARATSKLAAALNPALTGEIIDVEPTKPQKQAIPNLGLRRAPPTPIEHDPDLTIERE